MKILSWNCQGLGNPWTVRALHHLVKTEMPKIVFLSETCLDDSNISFLKSILGFENGIGIGRKGHGGGIALMWRIDAKVQVLSYSRFHIDARIGDVVNNWRLTGFYGRLEIENRHLS